MQTYRSKEHGEQAASTSDITCRCVLAKVRAALVTNASTGWDWEPNSEWRVDYLWGNVDEEGW
jgi:hypothetical protein